MTSMAKEELYQQGIISAAKASSIPRESRTGTGTSREDQCRVITGLTRSRFGSFDLLNPKSTCLITAAQTGFIPSSCNHLRSDSRTIRRKRREKIPPAFILAELNWLGLMKYIIWHIWRAPDKEQKTALVQSCTVLLSMNSELSVHSCLFYICCKGLLCLASLPGASDVQLHQLNINKTLIWWEWTTVLFTLLHISMQDIKFPALPETF